MGVRIASSGLSQTGGVTVTTTTETVIVISPPINLAVDNAQVLIFAYILFTPGTGTTSFAVRLKRGTTVSGTALNNTGGQINLTTTAYWIGVHWLDTPGIIAEQQYCATIVQSGATGNGNAVEATLTAVVL